MVIEGWNEVDEIIKTKMIALSATEYQCSDCLHICKTRQNLGVHIEANHVSHPEVRCTLCGALSTTRDALRKHLRRHRNPK